MSTGKSLFEGRGGDIKMADVIELQTEVSQLKFQNRKLGADLSDVRQQLTLTEDSNIILVHQRDTLEKRLQQSRMSLERSKEQLNLELDDTKMTLSAAESKNKVLLKRISKLERDLSDANDSNDQNMKEILTLSSDARAYEIQLKELANELKIQDELSRQQIEELLLKEQNLEEELRKCKEDALELTAFNSLLTSEKQELENALFPSTPSSSRRISMDLQVTDDGTFEEDELLPSMFSGDSLHAELTASLGYSHDYSLPITLQGLPEIDVGTQCDIRASTKIDQGIQCGNDTDFTSKYANHIVHTPIYSTRYVIYQNIPVDKKAAHQLLKILMQIKHTFELALRGEKNVENEEVCIDDFSPVIEDEINAPADCADVETSHEDVVRRINEELAEFRQQLKQSQELFHALNNSAQTFGATQSCPLLVEPEILKPGLVNCSTQTEERTLISPTIKIAHSTNADDREINEQSEDGDLPTLMEKMTIDGLDMESYRLAVNLPTVVEESEEAETSPGSLIRRMSSGEKGPRRKLVRMPNAVADDVKSDATEDYKSALSSLPGSLNSSTYNSLERPLQVSGHTKNGNGLLDDDTCSTISGEHTTYGSPLMSSPSSPTYLTPSQGSSSQETLTYDGGDRTPVNFERIEDRSLPEETDYFDSSNKQKLNYGITMPIDNRHGISSIGVIPESQQEHMKRYAYDAVARSCDRDAEILSRKEWRTLKKDLDEKELANYKKCFGQEDGGETDDGGCGKTSVNMDLDDEAEEHCENYSQLVEQLFSSLDDLKQSGQEVDETNLSRISQRFEQLALVFKTDHMNLTSRSESTSRSYESAEGRMREISNSLKQCLQKIRDHKLPGEIHEDVRAMEHTSQELEMYSNLLSRTARRAGRIDLETRLCKMIEVMILYVHILKTLHRNIEEDFLQARKLLEDNSIPLPSKKSIGKLHHNNNGSKVTWENDELDVNRTELMERFEDGKPKYALQHLLGPKQSNAGLNGSPHEFVLAEKQSSENFVLRYLSDWYEIVRRELYWPWNWDQTWKGLKQGFSGFIMVVGILVIAGSVFPNVGAQHEECDTVIDRLFTMLAKYGYMTHNQIPRL